MTWVSIDYIMNSIIVKHLFDSLGTRRNGSNTREGLGSGYNAELQRQSFKSLKENIAMNDNTCEVAKEAFL